MNWLISFQNLTFFLLQTQRIEKKRYMIKNSLKYQYSLIENLNISHNNSEAQQIYLRFCCYYCSRIFFQFYKK